MTKLLEIEGIGEVFAGKLNAAGVGSIEALLEIGATPKGRKDLAEKSGISGGSGPGVGQPCRSVPGQRHRFGILRPARRSRRRHGG